LKLLSSAKFISYFHTQYYNNFTFHHISIAFLSRLTRLLNGDIDLTGNRFPEKGMCYLKDFTFSAEGYTSIPGLPEKIVTVVIKNTHQLHLAI